MRHLFLLFTCFVILTSAFSKNAWSQEQKSGSTFLAPRKNFEQWGHDRYTLEWMFRLINANMRDPQWSHFKFTEEQKNKVNKGLEKCIIDHREEIEKLDKTVRKFQNQSKKDPRDRMVVVKLDEAEAQFQDYISQFIQPVYEIFQKELKANQYKELRSIASYLATRKYLKQHHYISSTKKDHYLKWPAWIAEIEGFEKKKIKRLQKAAKEQIEKFDSEYKRSKDNLFRGKSSSKLTIDQLYSLKYFISIVKDRHSKERSRFFRHFINSEKTQSEYDFSPKQLKSLHKIVGQPHVTRERSSTGLRSVYLISDPAQIPKIENLFSKQQRNAVKKVITDRSLREAMKRLDPIYLPLATSIVEGKEIPALRNQYASLLARKSSFIKNEEHLYRQAIKEILKPLSKKERKTIEKYMGKRHRNFTTDQFRFQSIKEMKPK